jgi:hypothetical protein
VTRLQAAWLHASSGPPPLLSATEANNSTSSFGASVQLDPLCTFDSSVQDTVRSDAALETDNQEAPSLIPRFGAPISAASITDVIATDRAAFDVDEDASKPAAVDDVDEAGGTIDAGAAPGQNHDASANASVNMTVDTNANAPVEPRAITAVACASMTATTSMHSTDDQTCAATVKCDVDAQHACDGGVSVNHQPVANINTLSVNAVEAVQTPANQSRLGHSHATGQHQTNVFSQQQQRFVSRHELVPPALPCFLDSKRREVVCLYAYIAHVALCDHQLQVLVQQRLYRGLEVK